MNGSRWACWIALPCAVALWTLIALVVQTPLLPSPAAVLDTFWQATQSGELPEHLLVTLRRVLFAFVLAMALGTLLGVWMGRSRLANAVLDPLLRTAIELGGVVAEPEPVVEEAAFQALPSANALAAIGMQAADVDPDAQPPPFYDAETGTAYWIGVFQSDKDDRANCVTSILSLRRDAQTGELQAQLAPCVPGNWDKACAAAEYLTEVAHKDGMEQVFDVAKGMALATGQRDLWQNQRGVPLEFDAARDIAADTRAGWEVEL